MNPVYSIIRRRLLQIGLPAAAAWIAWQKIAGRPLKIRALDLTLFCAGLSFNLFSIFTGPLRFGFPRLTTTLPPGRAVGQAVALTFDDGPDPATTPLLLDSLREAGVQATFFLLSAQVARHPDLARRIAEEGHTIGLHGGRHEAVALWSVKQIEQELRIAMDAMAGLVPQPHLYRPPYGFKSRSVQRAADRLGLQMVNWSVNPKDYLGIDAASLTARVLEQVKPGAIILLHDARAATVAALPLLLRRLRGRGYRCVRL